MLKKRLICDLNKYLKIDSFHDKSNNWLQVDNSNIKIEKIWYAVDVTNYILDKAIFHSIDMLIVHHWLYRWDELLLTWLHYQRIKKLIDNNICLYASHLPLDAHNEVWNNIILLKRFLNAFLLGEWEYTIEKFGNYKDNYIWFWLKLKNSILLTKLLSNYINKIRINNELYNFGNKKFIKSICFVSWWWADALLEAKTKWFDMFLTWEAVHSKIVEAKDLWQTICLGWHYETETFGVEALSEYISNKYNIETIFLDEKY